LGQIVNQVIIRFSFIPPQNDQLCGLRHNLIILHKILLVQKILTYSKTSTVFPSFQSRFQRYSGLKSFLSSLACPALIHRLSHTDPEDNRTPASGEVPGVL
jgi:hypothetical protein